MQRYRINHHWLIGIFVSSLVLAVASFFIWQWQIDRNANIFLKNAEAAIAEENALEAFRSYRKYLRLRPTEDEVRLKMGRKAVDVWKDESLKFEDRWAALGVLERTVRTTDNSELRRELALIFPPKRAIPQIEELLIDDPDNSELNALLVKSLYQTNDDKRANQLAYKLIGYDEKTDTLDPEKATLEGEPIVYVMLANTLRREDSDNDEIARRIMDQMIAVNPDSAIAYKEYSVFLYRLDEKEDAATYLAKAYELEPLNAEILSFKGGIAIDEEDFEEAKKIFSIGLEEHPDIPRFYQQLAILEARQDNTSEALEILDRGIKELGNLNQKSINLIFYKMDLLFGLNDYEGVDREIKNLSKLKLPQFEPLIDLQKARVLYSKSEWRSAAKELKRVRQLLFEYTGYQVQASLMLASCYERLGSRDLAAQVYRSILNKSPGNERAQTRIAALEALKARQSGKKNYSKLDQLVNATLKLPEAEQDWGKIDDLVMETAKEKEISEIRLLIIRARILAKRGMYDEARALIRKASAIDKDNDDAFIAAIELYSRDPSQGYEPAVKLLDRFEKNRGRSFQSLTQRAILLAKFRPEGALAQMLLLLKSTDDLPEAAQDRIKRFVGVKLEQMGAYEEAREIFTGIAKLEPNDLPVRMHIANLAFKQQDDAAIRESQSLVLDFVKSKDDANYLFLEAKRRMLGYSRKRVSEADFLECRNMLDAALKQRQEWHELYFTYGQFLLQLGGEVDLALDYFDKALEFGPESPAVLAIQIELLAKQGLYTQALSRMKQLEEDRRSQVLGRLEAEILIKTGDPQAGYKAAEKLSRSQPNQFQTLVWFADIAKQVGEIDVAATALRKALDLNPSNPDVWLKLVGAHVQSKDSQKIENALREANLYTDAQYVPLLAAKYYELYGQWQVAEDIYLSSYQGKLGQPDTARQMADFYLRWRSKDQANVGKASIYLNRILRAANNGEVESTNPHVVWARQSAARILLAKKGYQESLKAEQLLRQSNVNNQMSIDESELLTDILISRDDPQSLLKAKQLLSELRESNRLKTKSALQLAVILSRVDEQEASKAVMVKELIRSPKNVNVRTTYIRLLIEQGDYEGAQRGLRNLQEMEVPEKTVVELSAQLAKARGDQAELNKILQSQLPTNISGVLNEEQLKKVLYVAQLAASLEAYKPATELHTIYARRTSNALELTKFLAFHGDSDRAMVLLKQLFPDYTDGVISIANQMLATRREEIGDKHDEAIDKLIDAALQEDPDSINRLLVRATTYQAQEKYKESVAVYDKLLERDDLSIQMKAAVKNNLGFLLALLEQRVDEAEELINEAMETYGPVADMLDTRAVVLTAQGKYNEAIRDMKLALTVNRDPVKHFHLAKAYILAGNGQEAMDAWKKAKDLGLEKETLPGPERNTFEEIRQRIEDF